MQIEISTIHNSAGGTGDEKARTSRIVCCRAEARQQLYGQWCFTGNQNTRRTHTIPSNGNYTFFSSEIRASFENVRARNATRNRALVTRNASPSQRGRLF